MENREKERWYGEERVLVIDDEEMVRTLLSDLFKTYGYSILLADEGQQGIDLYRENHQNIQLVLVDMTMPNLDGKATVKELMKIDKNVKVLLMSGYSEQEVMNEFESTILEGFLSKPFNCAELMEKVTAALN